MGMGERQTMKIMLPFFFILFTIATCKEVKGPIEYYVVPFSVGSENCKVRCTRIWGCKTPVYLQKTLRCKLPVMLSWSLKISQDYLCGSKGCPKWYECVDSRSGAPVCVRLRLKPPPRRPFTELEGLLTLTSLDTKKQINVFNLKSEKWFTLYTFNASIVTTLKSYGRNVFWCQIRVISCCHLRIRDGWKGYLVSTNRIQGVDLAVDENIKIVFVALYNRQIITRSMQWQTKKQIIHVSAPIKMIEVSSRIGMLFVIYNGVKKMDCFNYQGNLKNSFPFKEVCRFMIFDEVRAELYTLYSKRDMGVIQCSNNACNKMEGKRISGVDSITNIIPYRDRIFVSEGRSVLQVDREGRLLPGTNNFTIPNDRFGREGRIDFFMNPAKVIKKAIPKRRIFKSTASKRAPAELLLVVMSLVSSSKVKTQILTLNITSGLLKKSGEFNGLVNSVDVTDHILYRCQSKPPGLFMTDFSNAVVQTETDQAIKYEACTTVAADSVRKMMFYITSKEIWRYDLTSHKTKQLPIRIRASKGNNILTDELENVFYFVPRGERVLEKYSYEGELLCIFGVNRPLRDVVFKSKGCMYNKNSSPNDELMFVYFVPPRNSSTVKKHLSKKPMEKVDITVTSVTFNKKSAFQKEQTHSLREIQNGDVHFSRKMTFMKFYSIGDQ